MFQILAIVLLLALALYVCAFILLFRRCYRSVSADRALVKTGLGGVRVVIGAGTIIFPLVHQDRYVTLQRIRLEFGPLDLQTGDGQSVTLLAEVQLQIPPEPDAVLRAARGLGARAADPASIAIEIREVLRDSLRTFIQSTALADLNAGRAEVTRRFEPVAAEALAPLGPRLVSLTITSLHVTSTTTPRRAVSSTTDAEGI